MRASPSASLFINCPFDKQYQPLFDAIVFCVAACGFVPRCTLELTDAAEVRIENIYQLIAECNHSIHDISRTEVEHQPYRLPRFNMPLELGIFLGAKRFGGRSSQRLCLIMDRAPYRYQRFISDIGGQDIRAHHRSPAKAIRHVRDWLQSAPGKAAIPGGTKIWQDYQRFRRELPVIAEEAQLSPAQLTFIDYLQLVTNWLKLVGDTRQQLSSQVGITTVQAALETSCFCELIVSTTESYTPAVTAFSATAANN